MRRLATAVVVAASSVWALWRVLTRPRGPAPATVRVAEWLAAHEGEGHQARPVVVPGRLVGFWCRPCSEGAAVSRDSRFALLKPEADDPVLDEILSALKRPAEDA